MVEVRLRQTANHDLHDIGRYTRAQWSENQAAAYIDEIFDVIVQIGEHPQSGQDLSEVRPGYRRRRAGHHLIFYVIMRDGSIEIARVLHEKTDVHRHIDDD